jgi:hypothetical protein
MNYACVCIKLFTYSSKLHYKSQLWLTESHFFLFGRLKFMPFYRHDCGISVLCPHAYKQDLYNCFPGAYLFVNCWSCHELSCLYSTSLHEDWNSSASTHHICIANGFSVLLAQSNQMWDLQGHLSNSINSRCLTGVHQSRWDWQSPRGPWVWAPVPIPPYPSTHRQANSKFIT